jgi:hypothetical protein
MNSDSEKEDDEDDVEAVVVLAAVVVVAAETELTLMASLPGAAGRLVPERRFDRARRVSAGSKMKRGGSDFQAEVSE